MATIKGIEVSEVLRNLQRKIDKDNKDSNGKGCFSITRVVDRFNEVLGNEHYNVEFNDFKPITSGNQIVFSVKCRISIIDDDNNILFYKEGYGATENRQSRDQNKLVNFDSNVHNATTSAFKNAAKFFSALGEYQYGNDSKTTVAFDTTNAAINSEQNDSAFKNFITEGSFFEANVSNRRGIVWKLKAHEIISDTKCKEEACEIVFYPDIYQKKSDTFNKIVVESKKRQLKIKLKVSKGRPAECQQYICREIA